MGVKAGQKGQRSAHQATAAHPRPVVAALLVWVLAACIAGTPTASPAATPEPSPTSALSPTPSSRPSPTPSPTPIPQAKPPGPGIDWLRQFGTSHFDTADAVAADGSGAYVVVNSRYGAGSIDAFVRKHDPDGAELWSHQIGASEYVYASAVAADASGVYVAGRTSGSLPGQTSGGGAFVRKYDPEGTELWTHQFGGSAGYASAVTVVASGVYVAGWTGGTLSGQTSAGGHDAFLRKYNPDGTELWTRQFGSSDGDHARDLAADASGVYVLGSTFSAGTDDEYRDAFVRKYDPGGAELWTHQFDTPDEATAVAADGSGVYVAGSIAGVLPGQASAGGTDAAVRKYDPAGRWLWTRQFGSPEHDFAWAVAADASGVYLAGWTEGILPGQTSAGGYRDAFVRKYDPNGSELWTDQIGSSENVDALALAGGASGVYVAGYTSGTLPGQTSAGDGDAFLVKYDL